MSIIIIKACLTRCDGLNVGQSPQNQETIHRHQICWHLDLRFPSLQNGKKYISAYKLCNLWYFAIATWTDTRLNMKLCQLTWPQNSLPLVSFISCKTLVDVLSVVRTSCIMQYLGPALDVQKQDVWECAQDPTYWTNALRKPYVHRGLSIISLSQILEQLYCNTFLKDGSYSPYGMTLIRWNLRDFVH